MGASARSITIVFMLQGLIIGLVGTTAGSALGLAISYVADTYRVVRLPIDVYQVSHVPFKVLPWDFAVVVVSAILICFVATLYPSRQAARLDPVQALRFE
jgi:lipoprotein-releasing system permease protein